MFKLAIPVLHVGDSAAATEFIAAVLVFIDNEECERGKLKLELYTPVTRVEASDPTGA